MTKTLAIENTIIQMTKKIADNFTKGIVKMAKVVCMRQFFSDIDKDGPESNETVLARWESYHRYVADTPSIVLDTHEYMDSIFEYEVPQTAYPGLPLVVVSEYEYHSMVELDNEIRSLYGSIINTAFRGGLITRDDYDDIMQDV